MISSITSNIESSPEASCAVMFGSGSAVSRLSSASISASVARRFAAIITAMLKLKIVV